MVLSSCFQVFFNFDIGGGDLTFKDDGTSVVNFGLETGNFIVNATASNTDIIFKGNDGGSAITALTLDMSAAGNAAFNGSVTAASLVADTITLNSSTLTATGSFTIDSGGDINIDASGTDINFKVDATTFLIADKSGDNARLENPISDGDILFRGNDGGSAIQALQLDMSDSGRAKFNARANINGAGDFGILTIAANTTAMDTNTNHQITLENTSQSTSAKGLINYKTNADSGASFTPVAFGGRTINPANATRTGAFCVYVADTDNVDVGSDERFRIDNSGNVGLNTGSSTGRATGIGMEILHVGS